MKIFRTKDGRVLQLADKEKIMEWDAEMPLIFIGELKDKRIPIYRKMYSKKVITEIENYVEEILSKVAIPKLIEALDSPQVEVRRNVAENLLELSKSNPDQLKITLPHIRKAQNDKDKTVSKLMKDTAKNYDKAQKRKQTAVKRKKLTSLRKNMDKIDRDYADGQISDSDYLKEQKVYLKLKREIEKIEKEEETD
ncbi:MAG: hypothetical protein ACTSYI_10655 [Promethearchaeota archaeon]